MYVKKIKTENKNILIIDFSPIWVRFIFNALKTHISDNNQIKQFNQTESEYTYNFHEFADIVIFNTISEICKMKNKFRDTDSNIEIVIAFDTKYTETHKYWRHELWSGYKHGRRRNAKFDWNIANEYQNHLKHILDEYSGWTVISVPGAEGDDVIFTLTSYFSNLPQKPDIIISSCDHDVTQCLVFENCKFWETKSAVKNKNDSFVTNLNTDDIESIRFNHVVFGDRGDYIQHIKSWSRFSDKFKKLINDNSADVTKATKFKNFDELRAYPFRHELNERIYQKYGFYAYSHPQFGVKTLSKLMQDGNSIDDILSENPIYKLNYELNKKLVLRENVPDKIQNDIIENYLNANTNRNIAKLIEYFTNIGAFELIGMVGLM